MASLRRFPRGEEHHTRDSTPGAPAEHRVGAMPALSACEPIGRDVWRPYGVLRKGKGTPNDPFTLPSIPRILWIRPHARVGRGGAGRDDPRTKTPFPHWRRGRAGDGGYSSSSACRAAARFAFSRSITARISSSYGNLPILAGSYGGRSGYGSPSASSTALARSKCHHHT